MVYVRVCADLRFILRHYITIDSYKTFTKGNF